MGKLILHIEIDDATGATALNAPNNVLIAYGLLGVAGDLIRAREAAKGAGIAAGITPPSLQDTLALGGIATGPRRLG